MEARNVFNAIIYLFLFLSVPKLTGQEKYLLFDEKKDTIIFRGDKKFFKIDNNLFDPARFRKIDTLNSVKTNDFSFDTVKGLCAEANRKIDNMILREKRKKTGVIQIIETYNEIFECIYIIQKISQDSYIRTRVWWIDY